MTEHVRLKDSEGNPLPNYVTIPGWEGSIGPGPGQYNQYHVYARNVQSGAGNCVCGWDLGDWRHVSAAPGVDVPDRMRRGSPPKDFPLHNISPTALIRHSYDNLDDLD